jgi:hypothetical protein
MPDEASVEQLGIREIPLPESVTGIVALVIRPDPPTIRAAYELADALVAPGAEQVLGPDSLPHVTLTQCALRAAPRARLRAFVARLEESLRGRTILLGPIEKFGQGFVFWCAVPDGPERRALQSRARGCARPGRRASRPRRERGRGRGDATRIRRRSRAGRQRRAIRLRTRPAAIPAAHHARLRFTRGRRAGRPTCRRHTRAHDGDRSRRRRAAGRLRPDRRRLLARLKPHTYRLSLSHITEGERRATFQTNPMFAPGGAGASIPHWHRDGTPPAIPHT